MNTPTASSTPNVLLVTGGGQGIGAVVARLAAARGYAVCVNYRGDAKAADQLVADIRHGGGHALAVVADVSSEADVVRLFKTVDRELGSVTALVNNAGTLEPPRRLWGCHRQRVVGRLADRVAQRVRRLRRLERGS